MKQLKLGLGLCWAVYWVINAMLFVALLSDSEGSPFRTMTLASLLAACYCGMRAFDKFVRLIAELKADGMRGTAPPLILRGSLHQEVHSPHGDTKEIGVVVIHIRRLVQPATNRDRARLPSRLGGLRERHFEGRCHPRIMLRPPAMLPVRVRRAVERRAAVQAAAALGLPSHALAGRAGPRLGPAQFAAHRFSVAGIAGAAGTALVESCSGGGRWRPPARPMRMPPGAAAWAWALRGRPGCRARTGPHGLCRLSSPLVLRGKGPPARTRNRFPHV